MQDKALVLDDNKSLPLTESSNTLFTDVGFNPGHTFFGEVFVHEDIGADLTVQFEASDTEDFKNLFVLGNSGAVKAADLKKGNHIIVPLAFCPKNYPYIRATYTGGTSGKISTVIVPNVDTNYGPYPHPKAQ